MVKKEVKLRATNLNHIDSDSILHEEQREEIEALIRITYTTIRIPESKVMKNKARRFESSSYEFESLHKLKQKVES